MATGTNNAVNTISFILVNTAITTYFLVGESNIVGTWASASFFFKAVRIA
jgi:hypothetical protein